MDIVLASGSPRRRELMALITPDYRVAPSTVEESLLSAPTPQRLVALLAAAKCADVAQKYPGAAVIGSDTVVDCGGEVFGKPKDAADARRMMEKLSGNTHAVHTGVCIRTPGGEQAFVATSHVRFFPIPEDELAEYIASEEPYDKAGAYAVQGRAACWLDAIDGDYYTIMGFPVSRVARALRALGALPL